MDTVERQQAIFSRMSQLPPNPAARPATAALYAEPLLKSDDGMARGLMKPQCSLPPFGYLAWFLAFFAGVAGAFEFAGSPGTSPHGLSTDGTNLWHTDNEARKVYKLNSQGQVITSFDFLYGYPRGLAYDDGTLFVATATRIYRLNAQNGAYISDFASPDPISPNHQGLALGAGTLWVASLGSSNGTIYGLDPQTGRSLIALPAPGTSPRGLVYHNGSLWNLDFKLYKLSPTDGAVQAAYPTPLSSARGLTYFEGAFVLADSSVDLLMGFDITNLFSSVYVAPSRFVASGRSLWIPYISSHPVDQTNGAIRRILLFQHGINDDAVPYFARARYAASQAGCLDETLVVSLQLFGMDKFTGAPPTNLIYWCENRFWGAPSAGPTALYPRSERFTSFELLDDFLCQLTTNAFLFPQLEEIVISGHSAGAQFVNRFAATSPLETTTLQGRGLTVRYVVMNPSSYVYFDDKRYNPATLDLSAGVIEFVKPSSPDPGYNDYGYGLEALYGYAETVGSNRMAAGYPSRRVIYLAGGADTGPVDLDVSPAAMLEGENRYQRCLIYYSHLKDHFGAANLPGHRLAVIPGVDHDSLGMITSADGLRYHFQGPLRTTRFSRSGPSATLSWTGGEGYADIQVSTDLQRWFPIAIKATSPFVDVDADAAVTPRKYYRLKEPTGP